MPLAIEKFGVPVILLAAVYGAFSTVLEGFDKINTRRDMVLRIGEANKNLTSDQRHVIMWDDYVPMSIGMCGFLLVFTRIVWDMPRYIAGEDSLVQRRRKHACRLVAALTSLALLGFAYGTVADILAMRRVLSDP
jgi:hypothetical protein